MLTETMPQTLTISRTVNAPPALVYRAFTNATMLREWLADAAQVDPRVKGVLFLGWNKGYQVAGEYTRLKENEQIAFSWRGSGEPGATDVEVNLEAEGDGTRVTLRHGGLGEGDAWARSAEGLEYEWTNALENLQSILETGLDLRFMRRPMMGAFLSAFDAARAERLGIPVKMGVNIDNVVDGLGAQKAGLQSDDLVIGLGGRGVMDVTSMMVMMAGHKAGDTIPVDFYRGADKHTVQMTLSGRPAPEFEAVPEGLATRAEALATEVLAELETLLADVTETEANQIPAPNEWSVNENLAHIIWTERFTHMYMWGIVGGDDSIPWPDNNRTQQATLLAVYPTTADLMAELKRSLAETAAGVRALQAEFVQRKASYMRLSQSVVGSFDHTRLHMGQIKATLATVRG